MPDDEARLVDEVIPETYDFMASVDEFMGEGRDFIAIRILDQCLWRNTRE